MTDGEEGDPACAVWGNCEPFPEERLQLEAMCRHCGGWRYRDYPTVGNWGVWEPDFEKSWIHAKK
ncbi:hypothetical protein GURKE_03680 [Brevundimonas phage vB_BpoS-Gurke]|uniref:Uncharacterized protein n=1 Tax=Brevundimonas phage vB_BpoS-Gurke TaxID=2948599 RepID=A0A9E7N280_9CAUD|nr:hypothetical protein GURKE_03680 [Brevundimonas phage vB_BpoS-Gurke]